MTDIERETHNTIFFIQNGDPYYDGLQKFSVEEILVHLASELYGKAYIENIEYIGEDEIE